MDSLELTQIFDKLVVDTQALTSDIKSYQRGFWLPAVDQVNPKDDSNLTSACSVLQDFWYKDGQDGRETRSCFGFIALPEHVLQHAKDINTLKESFKECVQKFQKHNKESWVSLKGELARRHPSVQQQLHFSGLSRLHLKQTWRTIPIIERAPSRIGFNWYQSGRSITKITVQQAYDSLSRLNTDSKHIQVQLAALVKLPSNTPLAKVQNLAPTMRANLFYEDGHHPLRQAMNISLPILIKCSKNETLPVHNSPDTVPPTNRARAVRSDRKIEDTPFLPSIRVHRYY
ncbi:hypothetical protein NBRC116188_03430 [Oceaniserpentilla sp. 4NH20-0058]|uniref:DNA replication terminus site-binding protein n=1 Tax=Oceaniserpentilla sp. 4NH20-0058 TaxID=3127660 RepID=UPI0031048812